MKSFLMLACLGCVACYDDAYVLSESEAAAIVRAEMSARGIEAAETTRVIDDIDVCIADEPCFVVSVALDGWDETERVGFAYLSDKDRGRPSSTIDERDEADAIQAELDTRQDTEGIVLVFREWAHETQNLAEQQFRSAVVSALTSHGIVQ